MFLSTSRSGYTRHGEQFAAGRFLLVFSHNKFMWEEQNNTPHTELTGLTFDIGNGDGFVIQETCHCGGRPPYTYTVDKPAPYYYLKQCPVHKGEYRTFDREPHALYAYVCHVNMRQLGQFMMGYARALAIRPVTTHNSKYLIVSGTYGSDGLPCDYEKLTPQAQSKLVRVPDELTNAFWQGGGHNTSGSEAPAMRAWAIDTFPKSKKRGMR